MKVINNYFLETKLNPLTETQKAYLAGLWDGEGYIGLTPRGERAAVRGSMSISLSNGNCIHKIADMLGVRYREEISFRKVQKNKAYRINIGSQTDMLYFAKQIEPYLILKKAHAQLLIKFLEYRHKKLMTVNNMKKAPHGVEEFSMMNQMRLLNKSNYLALSVNV